MVHDPILIFAAALFGLVIGSFMNVCIYRVPLGQSIVMPASSCPSCRERIRLYDNLPLVSYLLLGGRCRHCRAPIPWHYPVVEALAGLLSVALFAAYGASLAYLFFFLFACALVVISFIDLHHQIIPDVISLPGIAAGLVAALLLGHIGWLDSLIGLAAGGGALFLVAFGYRALTGREGMGGGDIKLLAMIGAWLGWWALPLVVLMASLSGALIGGAGLILSGRGLRVRIPFGPFLALGALLYLFFGYQITGWYFGLLGR